MDFQFYPTAAKTAALMWSKFKREIGIVCDPSAGQGHLLRHAKDGFENVEEEDLPWVSEIDDVEISRRHYTERARERARYKFSRFHTNFLAVEIDPSHHANLRELGGTVIGFDFLQVESLATVDQVIMNPPFSEGAKHVLHAWNVVYDAEIVAIVNAETIRNPYTRERQTLVELIAQYGSVEFLQEQFVGPDVERQTAVEVALIYLEKIPKSTFDIDSILNGLSKGDNLKGPELEPEVMSTLALPANLIENTYRRFVIAVDAARKASMMYAIAERTSSQLGVTLEEMQAKGVGNDFREDVAIRSVANKAFQSRYETLKSKAWAQIIRSTEINSKLSNQARRKVEAEAQVICQLEFTVANVHGFLSGLFESMGDIYSEMVCDLFDNIIGRSSDNVAFYKSWKSNERHRFGMRIKRTRFIIPRFDTTWGGSLCYESEQFLADIDKVFGYLHGIQDRYDGLVDGFKRGLHKDGDRVSTRFFDFRFFKGAGTIHFFPKSQEVVEKLNRFVGARRQWLPDQMDQSNEDFQRQYEEAEKLTKEYDKAWKGGTKYRYNSPVYAAIHGKRDDLQETRDQMAKCIETVHEDMGLRCGPALTAPPSKLAIACDVEEPSKSQEDEGGQLLLLVA